MKAVVVGGSSGIGAATARRLVDLGWVVVATGTREAPETPDEVRYKQCDVRQSATLRRLLEDEVHREPIDVLVYASGVNVPDREFEHLSTSSWDTVLDVNATGAFHCMSALLPHFRHQGGGLFILIGSLSSISPDRSGAAYQASKRALTGLAHAITAEEQSNGVRATVVHVGLTATNFGRHRRPEVRVSADLQARAIPPGDVADVIAFIAALPSRTYIPEVTVLPTLVGAFEGR